MLPSAAYARSTLLRSFYIDGRTDGWTGAERLTHRKDALLPSLSLSTTFKGVFRGGRVNRGAPPLDFRICRERALSTTATEKETKRKKKKDEIYRFWSYDGQGTPHPLPS